MLERIGPSIVRVESDYASASGVIFRVSGHTAYVITNREVIEWALQVSVSADGSGPYHTTVLGTDEVRDLAVLRVCCGDFRAMPQTGTYVPSLGDPVVVAGYGQEDDLRLTVTQGAVVSTGYDSSLMSGLLQTDAVITSGSSGGAALSPAGQILGIGSFALSADNVEGVWTALSWETVAEQIYPLEHEPPRDPPDPVTIPYDSLLNQNEDHKWALVRYPEVYVVEALASLEDRYLVRLRMESGDRHIHTDAWADPIVLHVPANDLKADSYLEFVGRVTGLATAKTAPGVQSPVPAIRAVETRTLREYPPLIFEGTGRDEWANLMHEGLYQVLVTDETEDSEGKEKLDSVNVWCELAEETYTFLNGMVFHVGGEFADCPADSTVVVEVEASHDTAWRVQIIPWAGLPVDTIGTERIQRRGARYDAWVVDFPPGAYKMVLRSTVEDDTELPFRVNPCPGWMRNEDILYVGSRKSECPPGPTLIEIKQEIEEPWLMLLVPQKR